MGKAVCSDLAYVTPSCCHPTIYRSVWDRLCQQLFGAMPLGMDTSQILPNIELWKDGVVRIDSDPDVYSFEVTTDDGESPKPTDIIMFKGKYYIIGEVD